MLRRNIGRKFAIAKHDLGSILGQRCRTQGVRLADVPALGKVRLHRQEIRVAA